jgi:TonB family protein
VNQASKIRLAVRLLALAALVIVSSAATTRAQEPVHDTTPGVTVHPSSTPENGVQLLTPTGGTDFNQYLGKMHSDVNKNWSASLPDAYLKGAKGRSIVRFDINRDGTIVDISLEVTSGNDSLDQAAINAVRNSSPLDPLPQTFKGHHIALRCNFQYNLSASLSDCNLPATQGPVPPPFDRLELLVFLADQGHARYETQAICQRGIDFTPDSSFLAALGLNGASPEVVAVVTSCKPRTVGQPSPERVSAYGLLDVALADARHRKLESAGQEFERALQLAPDSATLHLSYARSLLLAKKYSEAETQLRLSLQLWPEDADAHTSLAMALMGLKRDTEAVPEAREALRIYPNEKTALVTLGLTLARSGQYKEAIPILQQTIRVTPELPLIHKHLGVSLLHTGNSDAAIEELSLFLKTSPNDAEAHYFLGVALREKGKPDEALVQFREAARIEPSNPLYSVVVDPADSEETTKAALKPAGPRPDDCFFSDNVYTNIFFGFSYEFPKGWMVLKAEAGRAAARLAGTILANGDPTVPDMAEVGARNSYQLLFVTKQTTKDLSPHVSLIQISAMNSQSIGSDLKSGEDLLKLGTAFLVRSGLSITVVSPAAQFDVAGRTFWREKQDLTVNGVLRHTGVAVTVDKDYILSFVFSSPDVAKLDELVHTMQSLRFTDSSAADDKP